MGKILIFGHKNPDTDSICSALTYADLKQKLGVNAEPVRLGTVNKETQFALDYFNMQAPRLIEKVEQDIEGVALVDHNEFQQSADNIRDVNILEVIDHHRVANFETKHPLYFRVEPVGCTATILYKMYQENKKEIPKGIAGLMLSAIISDTLLLKSPTCTKEDIEIANKLAEIAEVNLEKYGFEMLQAGADLSDKSTDQLLSMDAKSFSMAGANVEIAQVNAVDVNKVFQSQSELEQKITQLIKTRGLSLFLLVVTDIINNNSEVLAIGEEKKQVEKAFNVALNQNRALLKGVVSRKKQIVTALTDAFQVQ